ncbi:MAG: hypothetical protein V4727_05400, partial [Verrucomicrobiota bacterium]
DEAKAGPKETDQALQKLLEQLIDQISAFKKERPGLEKELADLKAELAKRNIKPDTKTPPVRINPAGSGITANTEIFFIECNANGLIILDKGGEKKMVSAATIATDGQLASTLNRAKSSAKHLVLFLIRNDGNNTYKTAAVLAEEKYTLRTGKLPIPTQGEVDLSLFLNR